MTRYIHAWLKLASGLLVAMLLLVGSVSVVRAAVPSLYVTTTDNTTYQVTVSGTDSYSIVDFYTRQSDTQAWVSYKNIGTTDRNGYFSIPVNIGTYVSGVVRESYVIVNGQQSSTVTTNASSSGSIITFNQNNVTLSVGQNSAVTIYGGSGNYYVSANTNSAAISTSISGSTLTLYANASGYGTITICGNYAYPYYANNCGTLSVAVSGFSSGSIWFSPSSPTLYVGQSLAVSINSSTAGYAYPLYNNAYYVSSNSNPSVVSASISGTVLNIYANQSGSASITVNHNSLGWSGTVYVTVYGSTNSNNTVTFSNANPTVAVGQSTTVTVYSTGGYYYNQNYYVSGNTNATAVSASLNGQTLTVYGLNSGTATLTICQNNVSACGSLYVAVTGQVYGTSTYPNGQLINQYGTIYIVYKNTLTGFSNPSAFLGLGYSFGNAVNVGYINMTTSGYIINTQYAAHPWGSWIQSGNAIYFVHENGLIPVPAYDVFVNNGGRDSYLVQMNTYDWQRSILSPMTYGDYRLRQ